MSLHRSMFCLLLLGAGAIAPLATLAAPTGAEPAPITIEADRMQYDDRKQTNVFSGSVELVSGAFKIKAQRLRLSQDKNGNHLAIATGKPATFRQQREGTSLVFEGSGEQLRYNDGRKELEIINNATLRRIKNGTVLDEVFGAKIVYQSQSDFFVVEGGKAGKKGGASKSNGRVRVIIKPSSSKKTGGGRSKTKLRPSKSLNRKK